MTDSTLLSTDQNTTQSDHHTNTKSDVSNAPLKIAIIGGGLTGLFTATLLERAFMQANGKPAVPQITIFEKSRSVGRLATRYRSKVHSDAIHDDTNKQWQWAFGAQFFTAKTASFQQFIKPWLATNLLQPWCAQVVNLTPANDAGQSADIQKKEQWNSTQARYISTPKMTSWGRALADELQYTSIKFKTRVAPVKHVAKHGTDNQTKTELLDEEGNSLGNYDWVICTAPNGQALELMADSGFTEQAMITKLQMQACYTLMLGWDDVQQLPDSLSNQASQWDVAYVQDSILDRIFIEHQKPAHENLLPSVTIHARNDWSEAHVDDDIEVIKAQLLKAAQQALNWDMKNIPSQVDCHRWRYAATIKNIDNQQLGILVDDSHQWIVSGDWCGQGNIESCYQMAAQTVKTICSH